MKRATALHGFHSGNGGAEHQMLVLLILVMKTLLLVVRYRRILYHIWFLSKQKSKKGSHKSHFGRGYTFLKKESRTLPLANNGAPSS